MEIIIQTIENQREILPMIQEYHYISETDIELSLLMGMHSGIKMIEFIEILR